MNSFEWYVVWYSSLFIGWSICTIILISMVTLVILFTAILYVNLKSFTVKKVLIKEQEEYIMGTFHTDHFKKYANYSMAEMINAIDNINPDVIFIEAREMYFNEYGVVDGPVDMCVDLDI